MGMEEYGYELKDKEGNGGMRIWIREEGYILRNRLMN